MKGKLVLKNGPVFEGEIFGAETSSAGEVVFATGMVGYPESLTDPSFHGQILTYTFPLIGNYGVPEDQVDQYGISKIFESDAIHIKGLVCSEYSENFSHWHAKRSLGEFLKKAGIPGITGIDTRALTKILRTKGCMPGKIIADSQPAAWYDPNLENLVAEVSPQKVQRYTAKNGKKTIIVIDCGIKNNTLRNFLDRGINIIRVPWDYDFFEANDAGAGNPAGQNPSFKFDGVFISNGPGNPALLKPTVEIIKKCLDKKIPIFGICLGNQLMGIAAGAKTYKLKFGHRAQNQPCVNTEDGRCFMTSQNHGFAIDPKTMPKNWKTWFENANDKTIEGIRHATLPFMAVQFHPEACPGPVDSDYLFDQFIKKL